MMNKNNLKEYSVIVAEGSGCLFQPMTDEYTYILTAKHLFFYEQDNGRGKEKLQIVDGTKIDIKRCVEMGTEWKEEVIDFILIEGETYFPHNEADIAILKITPAIEGFDRICTSNQNEIIKETFLCGYPDTSRNNGEGDKYSDFKIERIISTGNNIVNAQVDSALNQNNISGISGGGILYIDKDYINIIGIQSQMTNSSNYQAGQVAFVPISLFDDIVEYCKHKNILTPLLPNFLKSFQFIRDNIFKLQENIITKSISAKLIKVLCVKSEPLILSEITPYEIKHHFVEGIKLLSKYSINDYNNPKFWSLWLELLTIISIAELQMFCGSKSISITQIPTILERVRLFYSDSDKCFWIENIDNLHRMNYNGLAAGSTIIVASNVKAEGMHILDPTLIVPDISRVENEFEEEKISGKIDSATDFPLRKYKFVNISAFKEGTVEKLDPSFADSIITDCIKKLKNIYGEILSNG